MVPQPASRKKTAEATGEEKTLEKQVENERGYVIDASIVKIMKTRKTEKHQKLVADVMEQVTMFKAQPPHIKKRIEDLIVREYLKRDDKDKATYVYMP